jgi:two-component system, OmpR family, sensor kinase
VKSLRRRLLVALWVAVCCVGALSAVIAYLQVSHQAKGLLDTQLEQIAQLVAGRDPQRMRAAVSEDSDIQVGTWRGDGTQQYASSPLLHQPRASTPGFSDIILGGEPYRLYAAQLGDLHVEVAQPVDVRDDQAEGAALAALLPMLLLMPVLAIVIAFVIRALLQPVRDLASVVARRDAFAEAPLDARGLPSEVVPLVEELNKLLTRQREAAQRERTFIADAAHALRTPLAALQLQADVLEGSPDPAERAVRLAELRAGIQRATRLSAQLLELAHTESNAAVEAMAVDLDAALTELYALYDPAAALASIELALDVHSQAQVHADVRRLLLIFGNLLDNALRYSPAHGRIELSARLSAGTATIEVRDQGPGIPEAEIPRVFERFRTAPDDHRAHSGLGLATVQSLVRQLGGSVSLHNRIDGQGLVARVSLPCANQTR